MSNYLNYKRLQNIDTYKIVEIENKSKQLTHDLHHFQQFIYDAEVVKNVKEINALFCQIEEKMKATAERLDEVKSAIGKEREEQHPEDLGEI